MDLCIECQANQASATSEECTVAWVAFLQFGIRSDGCIFLASGCFSFDGINFSVRLAPEHKLPIAYDEHKLPIAYDDSWEALQWVMSRGDSWLEKYGHFGKVFVAGDSAGANIAHQMAMRGVEMNIEGMMLIHPYFGKEIADPEEKAKRAVFWKAISSTEI